MIQIPEDIYKDLAVSTQHVADYIAMVVTLIHEGRLAGADTSDHNMAIVLLQKAVAAQAAQIAILKACLEEDAPERVQ